MRYRSADGEWVVDLIHLELTGTHHGGAWLRVARWGFHVADVRSIADLTKFVDLAELEQALGRRTA